uniref:Uncharacterized protein n=1 Tax=Panagrolaimus sp. PS1159 TaxID=55785 RepID=A0AC35FHU5_9BILA
MMNKKFLFAISLIFVVVIVVDCAIFSFPLKNTKIKPEFFVVDYVNDEECTEECKLWCNQTCGQDLSCRENCYIARFNDEECTEECKLWCNQTCGQDLSCRENCYIARCHCPEKVDTELNYEITNDKNEKFNFNTQTTQCSTKCITKCIITICNIKNIDCKNLCQLQCCQ